MHIMQKMQCSKSLLRLRECSGGSQRPTPCMVF